jgi:hypothetical protein
MAIQIQLRGGPCDGETHDGLRETTKRITRSAKCPGAFYDISDEHDAISGRRIFTFREERRSASAADAK